MKKIENLVQQIAEIYARSGADAEEYLYRARKLPVQYGAGFSILYCWFYSVPQKWTQVEPKIFELGKATNWFEMKQVLSMPYKRIAEILKPMIFRNEISRQLKKFCLAIKNEYGSWENFAEVLKKESIFDIFRKLRKHNNIRLTFKNLAAMKIIVGGADDLLILDRHVGQILGLHDKEMIKCKLHTKNFKDILDLATTITKKLDNNITTSQWALAIWFNRSHISAMELLIHSSTSPCVKQIRNIERYGSMVKKE